MVFRAQSIKPLYIPSGAVCILDLSTYGFNELSEYTPGEVATKRTSAGMAYAHIPTPAIPPANTIAPRFSWEGSCPAGVKDFFVIS